MAILRSLISGLLIVCGAALAPLAVVGNWTQSHLLDTNGFVELYGPLADTPEVKDYISNAVGTAVIEGIAANSAAQTAAQMTASVAALAEVLGVPSSVVGEITGVPDAIAQGFASAAESATSAAANSSAFRPAWEEILTQVHSELVSMASQPGAEVMPLTIATGPLMAAVQSALAAEGNQLASVIPLVDVPIEVAQVPHLDRARVLYSATVKFGQWAPAVAAGLLLLGVLFARRKSTALAGAALLTGISFGLGYLYMNWRDPLAEFIAPVGPLVWNVTVDPISWLFGVVTLSAMAVACVGLIIRLATGPKY